MQATRDARRGTGIIVIGLALLGLLAGLMWVVLDDTPAEGPTSEIAVTTPSEAATHVDRADAIQRLRDDIASRSSLHRPSDRPGPVFTGDRQEQIEHLRRD